MRIRGLAWLGLRTQQFDEMAKFFRDVMSMKPIRDEPGIAGFQTRASSSRRCAPVRFRSRRAGSVSPLSSGLCWH